MYNFFKVEVIEHVASVAFNRPDKANALHALAWIEMQQIFEDLNDNLEVRCIVLSGEGKHFCAGIDLSLLMDVSAYNQIKCEGRKREKIRNFIIKLQDNICAIEKCQKPVLAAIHEGCIGGGVDIATACDIRYCTDDAYFQVKEIDMGLVADIGTMQRLPKVVGYGVAAEMVYTGKKVLGKEAKEIGLVNKSFSDKETMMKGVKAMAKVIASKPPLVIRGTKHILQYTRDHSVRESLEYMATYNAAFLLSDDLTKSFEAAVTKNKPEYSN
ncbi:MAG: crotonase/enoyl-CoA hydratase family protein [Saprospiraceae bacterium]